MRLIQVLEGRDAPLYHGTQMPSLLSILFLSGVLNKGAHWGRPGEPDGVRLTRSFKTARTFAEEQELPGGVLELNQTVLAQRHKMVPYRDTDSSGEVWPDESEEVVIVDSLDPINRYLTGIYVQNEAIQETFKEMDWYRKNEGNMDDQFHDWVWADFESPDQVEELLLKLANHPLRKDMSFHSTHGPR